MALDDQPLNIGSLPPLLAGPILRRLTRSSVAVWVALSRGDPVTLRVQVAGQPGTEISGPVVTPVRVGSGLWLVVATAGAPGGTFAAGSLYEYRLTSPGWPEPAWSDFAFGTPRPAFPGPPADVADLVLLHTSCRKIHGGGRDGLGDAATTIRQRLTDGVPNARPNLLVMSGDQIYADEVPGPLAARVRRVATDLVGIDESGVLGASPPLTGRQAPCESFGFTSSAAANHLWSLGEFLAAYLLNWSDVLWPTNVPAWADLTPSIDLPPMSPDQLAGAETTWTDEREASLRFRAVLQDARRVLATVPSLMVPDDHEVTDDWNLDYSWANAVYANPKGSRVVANGVLAFVLCQHWGNVPTRFSTAGSPEEQVLAAATFTGSSPDNPALRGLLGVPTAPPPPPPSALRNLSAGGSVRYDFTLGPDDGWPVRLLALDERTAREFLRPDVPAARIALAALPLMLPTPPVLPATPVTLVVAPSPVLGTHLIEHVIQPASSLLPGGSEYADFESWSANTPHHQDLLHRLAAYAPTVLLGGDVHYSGTSALSYTRDGATTSAAGITSSASKNSDAKTMALHLFGDLAMRLGLERVRRFVGFSSLTPAQRAPFASPPPPGTVLPYDDLVDVLLGRVFRAVQESPVVLSQEVATAYGLGAGDWHYDVTPVDDERMPPPGPLLSDMVSAPTPWPNWDPAKSFAMLRALRASDLHRIGLVWDGLPQISVLSFSTGPLTIHHHLVSPAGEDALADLRHTNDVVVGLA